MKHFNSLGQDLECFTNLQLSPLLNSQQRTEISSVCLHLLKPCWEKRTTPRQKSLSGERKADSLALLTNNIGKSSGKIITLLIQTRKPKKAFFVTAVCYMLMAHACRLVVCCQAACTNINTKHYCCRWSFA